MKKIFISVEGLEDTNGIDYMKLYHAISDIVINNGYSNLYVLSNNLPILFYVYLVYNLFRYVDGLAICSSQKSKAVVAFSVKGLAFSQVIDISDAVKVVVNCKNLDQERKIIFPAHSTDTEFYAMTPEGDLICFYTGEDGILPEGYPTLEDLQHLFSEVVRECMNEKEVKRAIKEIQKEEKEKTVEDVIEKYSSNILLKFGYYYLSGGDSGDIAESILHGDMDFSGTLFWYFLDVAPQYESNKVREAIKKYFRHYLPVVEPEEAIKFNEGIPWEDTVSEELIREVLEYLIKYKDFWRKLKKRFNGDKCNSTSILLVNTKILPRDVVNTFLVAYPGSEILKTPGVYCINSVNDYNKDDIDVKVVHSLLNFNDEIAKNAVVVIQDADELLDFCREFNNKKAAEQWDKEQKAKNR